MSAYLAHSSAHRPAVPQAAIAQTIVARRYDDQAAGLPSNPAIHFEQGAEIYGEGDEATAFYKVVSGVVRICKFLSDGRRQIEAFHVAGDLFGIELGAEHCMSAEAVTDCRVVAYHSRIVSNLPKTDAALSQQLLSYALRNLARAQEHSVLLGRRSAMEKVGAFLLDWIDRSGGRRAVTLAMTRQDIADYLGLTIETVSRTISQMERDGIIDIPSVRQITVKDPKTLEALCA